MPAFLLVKDVRKGCGYFLPVPPLPPPPFPDELPPFPDELPPFPEPEEVGVTSV